MDTKGDGSPSVKSLTGVTIPEEGVVYVAIKGSLHANDCSAFGLGVDEIKALSKKFPGSGTNVVNGVTVKINVLEAINALSQLGYRIISSTGEVEITWTLQQKHDHDSSVCSCVPTSASVHQTVSEMDWERGIWYAALTGDIDRVQTIVDKANSPETAVRAPDNSGYTALHYASRNGHLNICRLLLDNGAQVDATTRSCEATPLHKAATTGNLEIVKLLIKYKACVDKQDVDGQTVLHRAYERKHNHLTEFLVKSYPQLEDIKDKKGRRPMDFLPKSNT